MQIKICYQNNKINNYWENIQKYKKKKHLFIIGTCIYYNLKLYIYLFTFYQIWDNTEYKIGIITFIIFLEWYKYINYNKKKITHYFASFYILLFGNLFIFIYLCALTRAVPKSNDKKKR